MSTEKCFCHITNSVTGEKYAVKDATARKELAELRSLIDGNSDNSPPGSTAGGGVFNHYTRIALDGYINDCYLDGDIYIHHVHSHNTSYDRNSLLEWLTPYTVFPATGFLYDSDMFMGVNIYGCQAIDNKTLRVYGYVANQIQPQVYDFTITDVYNTII